MPRVLTGNPSRSLPGWLWALSALLIVALLFPRFGGAYQAMSAWADQSYYIRLLQLADSGHVSEAFAANYMGPGYIAAVQAMKSAFALDSSGALILLNRLCTVLAITLPAAIYGWGRGEPWKHGFTAVGMSLLFMLSTPYLYQSGVPWSHFVFGFLAVCFILSFRIGNVSTRAFAASFFWGLAATVRAFDAWAIGLLLLAYLVIWLVRNRKNCDFVSITKAIGTAAIGIAVGYSLHAAVLRHFDFYMQYQGGMAVESYNGSALNFRDWTVKFVQFFVDPCYYSVCQYVDYQKAKPFVFTADPALSNWRMPFLFQLPFYVAALACGAALIVKRPKLIATILADPVLFIGIGAAVGMPVFYMAYLMGGADQLKYGFVRELFASSLFLMIVLMHLLTSDVLRRGEKKFLFWGAAFIAVIGLQVAPWWYGTPRLTGEHIARATAVENCQGGECSLKLAYFNPRGDQIKIPFDRYAMARIACTDGKVVSTQIVDLSTFRYAPPACPAGYRVNAISTTAGIARIARDQGAGGVAEHKS